MMSGHDIRYHCDDGHLLLGLRMPDLDIVTAEGATRVYAHPRAGRPLLLDFSGSGTIALGRWVDQVRLVEARFDGACVLPVIGTVSLPPLILVRPDSDAAWVGEEGHHGVEAPLELLFDVPRASLPDQTNHNRRHY